MERSHARSPTEGSRARPDLTAGSEGRARFLLQASNDDLSNGLEVVPNLPEGHMRIKRIAAVGVCGIALVATSLLAAAPSGAAATPAAGAKTSSCPTVG